jgi:hypothetical protein
LQKLLDINPVQPSRTSERTINEPKTCFQTYLSNSVPNPAPISVPSDIPVWASGGISARPFPFSSLTLLAVAGKRRFPAAIPAQDAKLTLKLASKSVTVVAVEQ